MEGFDLYTLIICLTVFVVLTAVFAFLVTFIIKQTIKMINGGLCDDEIIKKQRKKKQSVVKIWIIDRILPTFFVVFVAMFFIFSVVFEMQNNDVVTSSTIKVVNSGSMSYVNEKNDYLIKNGKSDQIQRFDLIVVNKLPDESELKVYDVVVYEKDGVLIVHRIVGIYEPDEKYSERRFLLQGDANAYPDQFPVTYSQMKGIYSGIRIAYVGSFVAFAQSPAGYICVGLIVFVCAIYPFIDRKIKKIEQNRLNILENVTKPLNTEEKNQKD